MKADNRQNEVLFWIFFGVTSVAAAIVLWPFVSAILWAVVLAVLIFPFYSRLTKRFSKNISALLATLCTAMLIVIPFAGIGGVAGVQAYHFVTKVTQENGAKGSFGLNAIAKQVDNVIKPVLVQVGLEDFDVEEYVKTHRSDIASRIQGPVVRILQQAGSVILTLTFALLTMFFMLRDGHRVMAPVCEVVPLPEDETKRIVSKMAETIRSVFVGVVLVSLIQAVIAGLTYWILGVPSPIVWAFVTFVFCTIPMLGGPVIYVPLAAKLILDGHVTQGVVLLVIGFGIISTVDNFLRPFFIGSRSDLHPMAIFFALLGGVLVMGPIGLMAGPLVLTMALALVDIVRSRRRLAESEAGTPIPSPS
ncbi:MAG: AI-2E family transporter [Chthonomonadaceae bacterium]|nr:AI-2E family transporter [Chthonomonadaceae bacterium]